MIKTYNNTIAITIRRRPKAALMCLVDRNGASAPTRAFSERESSECGVDASLCSQSVGVDQSSAFREPYTTPPKHDAALLKPSFAAVWEYRNVSSFEEQPGYRRMASQWVAAAVHFKERNADRQGYHGSLFGCLEGVRHTWRT